MEIKTHNPKFTPSDIVIIACFDSLKKWQEEFKVDGNFNEPVSKLAMRVTSWVGPRSVSAGVEDLMGPYVRKEDYEKLIHFSDLLSKRLIDGGLLGGALKRGNNLGT